MLMLAFFISREADATLMPPLSCLPLFPFAAAFAACFMFQAVLFYAAFFRRHLPAHATVFAVCHFCRVLIIKIFQFSPIRCRCCRQPVAADAADFPDAADVCARHVRRVSPPPRQLPPFTIASNIAAHTPIPVLRRLAEAAFHSIAICRQKQIAAAASGSGDAVAEDAPFRCFDTPLVRAAAARCRQLPLLRYASSDVAAARACRTVALPRSCVIAFARSS